MEPKKDNVQADVSNIQIVYNKDNDMITLVDPVDKSHEFRKLVWLPYIKELFTALLQRTTEPPDKGLNKFALHTYMSLPGLIGDSFFRVLDTSKDGYLDQNEFINGLVTIYFGEFEEKLKFIFEMYDFDANGLISKEDIRTMLSYVPISKFTENSLKKEGLFTQASSGDAYFDRLQVQNDLIQLFNYTLKDKNIISLDDFRTIVSKSSSDMFLCLFMLIREKLPAMTGFMSYNKDYKPVGGAPVELSKLAILASPRMSKLSPSLNVLSRSPFLKAIVNKGAKLTPSDLFNKYLPVSKDKLETKIEKAQVLKYDELPKTEDELPENILIPVMELNKNNIQEINQENGEGMGAKRLPNVTFAPKNPEFEKMGKTEVLLSPSAFLEKRKITTSMAICSCGKLCEIGKVQCAECLSKGRDVHGYLYLKQESKLKRFWIKLNGSSLFGIRITSL